MTTPLKLDFDRRQRRQFRSSVFTTDACRAYVDAVRFAWIFRCDAFFVVRILALYFVHFATTCFAPFCESWHVSYHSSL